MKQKKTFRPKMNLGLLLKSLVNHPSRTISTFFVLFLMISIPLTIILSLQSEKTDPKPAQAAATRDPLKQPFASNSIWNLPIGANAQYVNMSLPRTSLYIEDELVFLNSINDPLRDLQINGQWATCNTGSTAAQIKVPDGYTAPARQDPDFPNRAGGGLLSDNRSIKEFQYAARCSSSGPVTGNASRTTYDIYGAGIPTHGGTSAEGYGAHGGSALSGVGGALRKWEVQGTGPIQHALKVTIVSEYLSNNSGSCYRWPAITGDGGCSSAGGNHEYTGNIAASRMGALVAIRPTENCDTLVSSSLGRRICKAFQDYGAYVVDSGPLGWGAHVMVAEYGNASALYGISGDMLTLFTKLHVVDNWNKTLYDQVKVSGGAQGAGGGTPRTAWAPDLCPTIPCSTSGDTQNPTATLTAPTNGATVSGSSVTLSANASDNVGVTQVQFFVDGQSVNTDTSSPYSFAWNSTTKANGTYQVFARAVDAAGNQGNSTSINITVSNTTTTTNYTIDQLVADAGGNNDGSFCDPPASYDWGQKGDGLPSTLGTVSSNQITGWGTVQWKNGCGASASGVRFMVQNFKMYGWNGSSWFPYNGNPGDWCSNTDPNTATGYTACSNSGTTSSPNWAMPTGQRALHWATQRMTVQSGTRCVALYYEGRYSGGAPVVMNIGADRVDPGATGIIPRIFLSRYKTVSSSSWTPIGGSSCPETLLRSNPPPFLTGGTNPPGAVTLSVTGTPASGPYAVEATTTVVGDVKIVFRVDGAVYRTENDPPYMLFGDGVTSNIGAGSHTIRADVYAQTDTTNTTSLANTSSTVTEGGKIGDTNGDGKVDTLDLSYILSKWGTNDAKADINKDGIVSILDLSALLANWG